MNHDVIQGERIYLRPLTRADATADYVAWLNDPETTRYMESGRRVETVESIASYIERYENRDDARFFAIILRQGDRHVGNVKLEPVNWVHGNAVLGIMLGDAATRGMGLGTEVMRTMFGYAFDVLKLHRVTLGVTADNAPAIRCYEKAGMKHEGRWREGVRRDGGYVDSLWMGILESEFRSSPRS